MSATWGKTLNTRSIKRSLAAVGLASALAAQPALAGPFSALYVFGDSLSDSGNNSSVFGGNPLQVITGNTYLGSWKTYGPAPLGTYSNGPVWASYLASSLGVSALPSLLPSGTNYAYGGATTSGGDAASLLVPNLLAQTSTFLLANSNVAPANALYVVAGGSNNARITFGEVATQTDPGIVSSVIGTAATTYAADVGSIVDQLQAAGAQNIIVWNPLNLGLTPWLKSVPVTASGLTGSQLGSSIAGSFNNALASRLTGEAGVKLFDLSAFMGNVVSNPAAKGLTDVTNACGAGLADCATSLYYDAIHPTTFAHQKVADAVYALAVPEPSELAMMALGLFVVVGASRRTPA